MSALAFYFLFLLHRDFFLCLYINQCSFHTQLVWYFTSDPQCICESKHVLCTWHKVLSAANIFVHAYMCACDHVHLCTPVYLAWCVKHCKPISPKQDSIYKTRSKCFLERSQWNGPGAKRRPPFAVKQEELVYQPRLTPDSFIVQSIPRWLDYRGQESGRIRDIQKRKTERIKEINRETERWE